MSAIFRWATRSSLYVLLLSPLLSSADEYDDYNAFALGAFGAERDALVYQWFGNDLQAPADLWEHVSESSAAVGFSSNLPALSYVQYGPTTGYGSQTPVSDRPYYQHLHHLTDLLPDQTTHYRIVLEDERGNVLVGEDRTLDPATITGAIRIPDDLAGPPYVLDAFQGHYLVTADIVADGKAFEIIKAQITLDLGGRTIVYNEVPQAISGSFTDYRDQAAFGVQSIDRNNLFVVNGTIRQGQGQNAGHPDESVGFNPIYAEGAMNYELAGVVLEYAGAQLVGYFSNNPAGQQRLHHNVFLDRGTQLTNRHAMGSKSFGILGDVNLFETHHNLVKRTRQSGLDGGLIYDNEIHVDSWTTNSYGIPNRADDREGYGNKIFGTGYHMVAVGWGSRNWWHDNFIHLSGQGPDQRWPEYGDQESLNGFRLTQYSGASVPYNDNVIENNLVLATDGFCSPAQECTQTRGLQYFSDPDVVNNVIANNTIKVDMNPEITQAAAIVTQGQPPRCGTEAPVFYVANTLISNIANVRMGDYYGAGCNHRFYGNEMIQVGSRPDYRTFLFDWPSATVDQFFFDTSFSGGAGFDSIEFSQVTQEFCAGWTLTVTVNDGMNPIVGASVVARNNDSDVVLSGTTDAYGRVSAELLEYIEMHDGREFFTPLEIETNYEGEQDIRVVALDSTTEVTVELLGVTATPPATQLALTMHAAPSVMSGETSFRWRRALAAPAELTIFDARGRLVRSLRVLAGSAEMSWDGRDGAGRAVGSGVYHARLIAGSVSAVSRVVVLR